MFKKAWRWIIGVETTVAHIVEPMTNLVTDLEHHAESMLIKQQGHVEKAATENVKAIQAKLEADKAEAMASNFKKLLG